VSYLVVSGLRVLFPGASGTVRAVDEIDLDIREGDRVALIGESGCGKTVLGMAILRLLPGNAEVGGVIRYQDHELVHGREEDLQKVRGREIALIPQNSGNVLNPVLPVGRQIAEVLVLHRGMSADQAGREVVRLLRDVEIPRPERIAKAYPHELSGGMRERVLIATALACNPSTIIADEPTSGLDPSVKCEILHLLMRQCLGRTLLLITHDLGAAAMLCTRIAVMYAGEIVEIGDTADILSSPRHPYTRGLLGALPSRGLHPIPGSSPSPTQFPEGCRFHPRCVRPVHQCSCKHPDMRKGHGGRATRCWCHD
jgi:peptide/nickel transport system ATP-binding protein